MGRLLGDNDVEPETWKMSKQRETISIGEVEGDVLKREYQMIEEMKYSWSAEFKVGNGKRWDWKTGQWQTLEDFKESIKCSAVLGWSTGTVGKGKVEAGKLFSRLFL